MAGVFLDTGPLVALIIGSLRPDLIGKHRRVREYDKATVERIADIDAAASHRISIPNVLTEVSNHLGDSKQSVISGGGAALAGYIANLDEIYAPSVEVVSQPEYLSLGLSDAAIFAFAPKFVQERVTVVTQDHNLCNRLLGKNVDCVNVFHWRTPEAFL